MKPIDLDVVFQNTDGDGLVTLSGDVILTCEASPYKKRHRQKFRGMKHYFPKKNYRMTASWFEEVTPVVRKRCLMVHESGDTPPTPRRDILLLVLTVLNREVAFICGHAVNSAWAPRWKPTSFRRQRRALWWVWYRRVRRLINSQHKAGRPVVLVMDANRQGDWTFPGMTTIYKHGPDRVMVSTEALRKNQIDYRGMSVGPKTGNGRVTHHALKASFRFFPETEDVPNVAR